MELNRLVEAESVFLELQKADKKDVNALQGLGWVYFIYGKNDKAKKFFSEEIAWANNHINNSDYDAYAFSDKIYIESVYSDGNHGLGLLSKRAGDYKSAAAYLEKAANIHNQFTEKSEILTALGDCYLEQLKYSDAAAFYSKAVSENRKNLTAHLKLAWSYYYDKKYDMAEKAFEKAQDTVKESVEAVYGLALSRNMLGKSDKVRENLASGIALSPYYMDNVAVHEIIEKRSELKSLWKDFGLAYYKSGYYAAAIYKLDGYLEKINPNDFDALVAAGWSYRWLGYLDKAIDSFNAALKINTKADEPYVGLGSAYLAYGRTAESADSFSKALTVNSNSAIAYNGLAYLYSYQKDAKKTEDALKKSVSIKKDYFDSQAFLANLYLSQKRYAEAAKEYENALEIDKTLVTPLNGLGWSYYYSGRFGDARKSFEESRKLNPYLGEPHYGLALCYLKTGDIDKAKESFTTAIYLYPAYMDGKELYEIIDNNPKLKELNLALGWSYYYYYYYDAARFHFNRALKSDATDRDAMLGLGTISYVLGDFKASVETFGKLVDGLPKTAESWDKWSYMQDNLGWSYFYSKEYNKALETFRRLEGYHPKIKYIAPVNGQAWSLLQTGNKSEAEKLFRESLKIVPGNYSAEMGIKSLKK